MIVLDDDVLDAVGPDSRVFWGGDQTPLPHFTAGPAIYDPDADFRLPPDWHGTFDVVYLTERDLGDVKQWPLVVDEALRLLTDGGLLFLRFTQGRFTSIFQLKSLLRAWPDGRVELLAERTWPDSPQTYLLRLRVRRPKLPAPLRSVTFGVITDGRKPASVSRFVESVLRLENLSGVAAEVLVCGPPGSIDHLVVGREQTRLVVQPEAFTSQGWITRKKNQLVEAATGEVVVVAHDRYELAPDFLTELVAYGPDFALLVCRQETLDGRRFPDWVTIGAQWSFAPVGMMQYGDWEPGAYVNGGVMIARREVLLAHPWNDMLFWNQAEDVELSRRLFAAGVVARLARSVTVRTALSREDQMSAFEMLPLRPDVYTAPGQAHRYELGRRARLQGLNVLAEAQEEGIGLPTGWQPTTGAPCWAGTGDPEFAVTVYPPEGRPRELRLTLRLDGRPLPGTVVGIRVNGHQLETLPTADLTEVTAVWPAGLVPPHHTARVELLTSVEQPIGLASVHIDVSAADRVPGGEVLPWGGDRDEQPPCYASGWGHSEDWGRWSVRHDATLRVPVGTSGQDLVVALDVMALVPLALGEQRVVVRVAGTPMAVWLFTRSTERVEKKLSVPARATADGWLDLEFQVTSPVSPASEGINPGDWRPVGIGLASVTVSPARGRA